MVHEPIAHIEFHDAVEKQIRIFNEIFRAHSEPELFDNPDVEFDTAWYSQRLLRFILHRSGSNSVHLEFYLESNGFRIDFENYPEAMEVGFTRFEEKESEIRDVLERLLTCPILVEYKGNAKFVNLFNRDGSRYGIWGLQSTSALLFRGYWKSQSIDQHLFAPIYPSS